MVCARSFLILLVFSKVGANFLETVVRRFDKTYSDDATIDKECDNLVCIIAHLYNFHVVHALLVFDILKKLVTRFSSKDIELVLLVLKNVGFVLRKDDPLALKDLISEAQRKASSEGERFQDQTRVRLYTQFLQFLPFSKLLWIKPSAKCVNVDNLMNCKAEHLLLTNLNIENV